MGTRPVKKYDIDVGKLITIFVVLTFIAILAMGEHISDDALLPFITLILGYVFGNGALAVKGKRSQPMIAARKDDDEEE